MVRERSKDGAPGIPLILLAIVWAGGLFWLFYLGTQAVQQREETTGTILFTSWFVLLAALLLSLRGFFLVNPNEAKVLQLFGDYAGTAKVAGLRWSNPFFTRKRISLRVRNFESSHLKVNDADGNPIE